MTTTECPDCGKYFVGSQCECGYAPKKPAREGTDPWQRPTWMDQPQPCTKEENYRAAENVKAVLNQEITVEQARLVLHAIFQGRELELDA